MVGKLNKILVPLLMLLIPLSVFVSSAAAVLECVDDDGDGVNDYCYEVPASTPTPTSTPTPAPTPTTVVSVPDVKNATNTNTTIQLKVENVNKLAAAKIDIIYTQNIVNVVNVSAGDFNKVTEKIDNSIGKTSIIAFNGDSAAKSGTVVFAKIVLKAIGQKNDKGLLNLSVQSLSDENGNDIPFTVRNGTFKITALQKGDISNDATVNISDALLIAKYGVGLTVLDPDQLEAADINGDGKVNVVDAYLIAKYTVGKYTL